VTRSQLEGLKRPDRNENWSHRSRNLLKNPSETAFLSKHFKRPRCSCVECCLQRFATEDRVVDDSLVSFEVVRDGWPWPHFSAGQKIEMRLVHIFEMRDGKISKEIVFDMGRPV
jgi:hypothetical protein